MIDFFNCLASLSAKEAWILFISIAFCFAIVPYIRTISAILMLIIKREKPEIVDFSWRIAPAQKVAENHGKSLFYLGEKGIVYKALPIRLTWNVKGAYRIDVEPGFRQLKQNNLITLVKPNNNRYRLIAYTLKGKLEASLTLDDKQIVQIQTAHWGGANPFEQPEIRSNNAKLRMNSTWSRVKLKDRWFLHYPAFGDGLLAIFKSKNGQMQRNKFLLQTRNNNRKMPIFTMSPSRIKGFNHSIKKKNNTI